jgi:hypothetical protein
MKSIKLITASLLLSSAALAGTAPSGKAPVGKGPIAPAPEPAPFLTGAATIGYDSGYYFRGLWFSNNNLYGSVNLSAPIADKLTLSLTGLYTETLDTDVGSDLDYSELDVVGALTYDAGFAKFGLQYTHYEFFDTFSGSTNGKTFGFDNVPDSTIEDANELALITTIPVGSANLYFTYAYDFTIKASYLEAGADYTFKLNDMISLVPSVQVGYGVDYYTYEPITGEDSAWTHVRAGLAAPIKLAPNLTLTPYVAANFALEGRDQINTIEGKNALYGGVSLSYSF